MAIKAILWDYDGTLMDSSKKSIEVSLEVLSRFIPDIYENIPEPLSSRENFQETYGRISDWVELYHVCYGLNDCGESEDSVERYVSNLQEVFTKLKNAGSEIIFMTPNMMCTKVSPFLSDPDYVRLANAFAKRQEEGWMDKHMEGARVLCREMDIPVCDCYALWKNLYKSGVDVSELLANKLNHPTRDMNWMFAYELVKTMFGE